MGGSTASAGAGAALGGIASNAISGIGSAIAGAVQAKGQAEAKAQTDMAQAAANYQVPQVKFQPVQLPYAQGYSPPVAA